MYLHGQREDAQAGKNGKVPPVGATVAIAQATWTNNIGDLSSPRLEGSRIRSLAARFYYAPVIEIPTDRLRCAALWDQDAA
jgi:hypothetical protein